MAVPNLTQYRRANLADAARLAAFAERVFRESYAAQCSPDDLEAYSSGHFGAALQRAELEDTRLITLLVERNREVLAYAQLRPGQRPDSADPGPGPTAELQRIYVDHAQHGKGIGRDLIARCTSEAERRGCTSMWLSVWQENRRAIQFYKKAGFTIIGEGSFVMGSEVQTDHIMALRISGAHG